MANRVTKTSNRGYNAIEFLCPGCDIVHCLPIDGDRSKHPVWQWNGDLERPTLSPSILSRSGHYAPGHGKDECWCTYNAEHPDEPPVFTCHVCHSFLRDGCIEFLSDCTHSLAGQMVDLTDVI